MTWHLHKRRNKTITRRRLQWYWSIIIPIGDWPLHLYLWYLWAHAKPCATWAINYALSQPQWPVTDRISSIPLWFALGHRKTIKPFISSFIVFCFFWSSRCPALLCCCYCSTLLHYQQIDIPIENRSRLFKHSATHLFVSSTIVLHNGRRICSTRRDQNQFRTKISQLILDRKCLPKTKFFCSFSKLCSISTIEKCVRELLPTRVVF